METMQNSSCGCQTISEEPRSTGSESCSSNGGSKNACQMLSDPKWIKANLEYFPAGFAVENGIFKDISPTETLQMIQKHSQDQNFVVLDVKTEQEYIKNHLPASMLIDFFSPSFKDDLFRLDKNKIYIVICKMGVRSEIAMNLMKKMGFKEVYNVLGGDDRWFAEEIPYN
jgi:rhodanese-related sulfurtransferase